MDKLSERVEREFSEWKEKYEIPYYMEFQIKTLLKLQEEYDDIEAGYDNTRTRETLLHMIQDLQKSLILKDKAPKIMYVDYICNDEHNLDRVVVYIDDCVYMIKNNNINSPHEYTQIIKQIAEKEKATIYIDIHGYGVAFYDELSQDNKFRVKKLTMKKDFILN
jgi:hypothetical protein